VKETSMRDTSGQDKVITVKPQPVKKVLVSGVAILTFVFATFYVWPSFSLLFNSDMTISAERLRFATIAKGDLLRDISVQGKIVAANSPTLYATSSGIVSLNVKAGDSVNKGQQLAEIDSPELKNRLSQEQSTYDQLAIEVGRHKIQIKSSLLNNQQAVELASVNFEVSDVDKKRAEFSIKQSLISKRELEQSIATYKRADLAYRHAKQNMQLQTETMQFELRSKESQLARQQYVVDDLKRQVTELKILSPTDGIIGSVNIREKDTVANNSPLITVIDLSAFEVEVNIPENYADDLGVGLSTEINFNGEKHQGELTAISPEVTNGQVVGRMRFLDVSIKGLRQNQRVTARVLIESKTNILKVKRGAFVESGGGRLAYVVTEQGAVKRKIELGARSIGEIEVLSGLKVGEKIIISSIDLFNGSELINITK